MNSETRSKTWLQPWIYAAAAAQALLFNALQNLLAAGITGGLVSTVVAASAALPALLLILGFRPGIRRAAIGGALVTAASVVGLTGGLTTYIYVSMLLIPVLTAVLLPSTRLRPWKEVVRRILLAAAVAILFFATMIFVPYPLGWIVALAPWLGLAGEETRPRHQLLLPIGIGLSYGFSLVAWGPFSSGAIVSGCIGFIGLSALLLLGRSEAGTNPSPYNF
ncbi:hypothetical protein [Arthrobacter sp. HMWF013]|uniref:hypothetical protein n=1 Tax=Arthrobacter sp. HMWF013 TaxID=2056849 RepID=UPI0011B1F127|nr:hypothetical protein [Arthrobacter sp. HMWF013]